MNFRSDFPILSQKVGAYPLIYLDNAATTQKPKSVIDALSDFYLNKNANVHRGAHTLSHLATEAFEAVREKTAKFIGCTNPQEIIFTKGTTDSVNLVATAWGEQFVHAGDIIAATRMEHHSNFVPWQNLAKRKAARFEIVELNADYTINYESLERVLALRPKLLAVTAMSNVLGTKNDISKIAGLAKASGVKVCVDAAQWVAHSPTALSNFGSIDFLVFSSHKMYGPNGVGVLWGREALLNEMAPYQYGGNMVSRVEDFETTWAQLPAKFEAGTPAVPEIVAFGAALDYLAKVGMQNISRLEEDLISYTDAALKQVSGLKVYGPKTVHQRGSVFSFAVEGTHPHDLSTFLDSKGIAVRAGHHCAHPLMRAIGVPATTRASLSFYNTKEEIDALVLAVDEARNYFTKKGVRQ